MERGILNDAYLLDGDRLRRISSQGKTWKSWSLGRKPCVRLSTSSGYEITLSPGQLVKLKNGWFVEAERCVGKEVELWVGERKRDKKAYEWMMAGVLVGRGRWSEEVVRVPVREDEESIFTILSGYGFYLGTDEDGKYLQAEKTKPLVVLGIKVDSSVPLSIVEKAMELDSDSAGSFLTGLFEGCGMIDKDGRIIFRRLGNYVAHLVQILLLSFGCPSVRYGYVDEGKTAWLSLSPGDSVKFFRNVGFYDPRKANLLNFCAPSQETSEIVISLEEVGRGELYDFAMLNGSVNFVNGFTIFGTIEGGVADEAQ